MTFFKKIRKKLLSEGNTGKYLKYAIGEITLVVIGILIALQINNWNEAQKDERKAIAILEAIRSDMAQDLEEMKRLKNNWGNEIMYFTRVYPPFNTNIEIAFADSDTTSKVKYEILFGLPKPFRSKTSAFDGIIAESNSDLIANKKLFSNIQVFYTFNVPSNEELFQNLRQQQSDLRFKYAHIITYKPYKNISDLTDEYLIADLNIYFESLYFYYSTSFVRSLERLSKIIAQIDEELKK